MNKTEAAPTTTTPTLLETGNKGARKPVGNLATTGSTSSTEKLAELEEQLKAMTAATLPL